MISVGSVPNLGLVPTLLAQSLRETLSQLNHFSLWCYARPTVTFPAHCRASLTLDLCLPNCTSLMSEVRVCVRVEPTISRVAKVQYAITITPPRHTCSGCWHWKLVISLSQSSTEPLSVSVLAALSGVGIQRLAACDDSVYTACNVFCSMSD